MRVNLSIVLDAWSTLSLEVWWSRYQAVLQLRRHFLNRVSLDRANVLLRNFHRRHSRCNNFLRNILNFLGLNMLDIPSLFVKRKFIVENLPIIVNELWYLVYMRLFLCLLNDIIIGRLGPVVLIIRLRVLLFIAFEFACTYYSAMCRRLTDWLYIINDYFRRLRL